MPVLHNHMCVCAVHTHTHRCTYIKYSVKLLTEDFCTIQCKCDYNIEVFWCSQHLPVSLIVNGTPNPGCPITPQLPLTLTLSPISPERTEFYTGSGWSYGFHREWLTFLTIVSKL